MAFSSTLFLVACDDSHLQQKILEGEKQIVQLASDLKKAQLDLQHSHQELDELKIANAALMQAKEELEKIASDFPALQVKTEVLFDQTETLPLTKEANSSHHAESEVTQYFSINTTQVAWLNELLWKETSALYFPQSSLTEIASLSELQDHLRNRYQSMLEEAKEFKFSALNTTLSTHYLGQRNHIVQFEVAQKAYTGGVHGTESYDYINIDTIKKSVIRLDELVPKNHQPKLKSLLWKQYKATRKATFISENEFRISPNFYFEHNALVFSYPAYELGSYAEGIITLRIADSDINELLSPEYQFDQ